MVMWYVIVSFQALIGVPCTGVICSCETVKSTIMSVISIDMIEILLL